MGCVLWPLKLIWGFFGFLLGVLGRILCAVLGFVLVVVGIVLCITVIGVFAGAPIIMFGLLMMVKSIFP